MIYITNKETARHWSTTKSRIEPLNHFGDLPSSKFDKVPSVPIRAQAKRGTPGPDPLTRKAHGPLLLAAGPGSALVLAKSPTLTTLPTQPLHAAARCTAGWLAGSFPPAAAYLLLSNAPPTFVRQKTLRSLFAAFPSTLNHQLHIGEP